MTSKPGSPQSIAPAPLDAAASDPKVLGWMQGFPPAPDKIIRFADGGSGRFPAIRWSFSHMREFCPTRAVSRGAGPPTVLPRNEQDLDGVPFTAQTGEVMTWEQGLQGTYADAIVVLHRGAIAYERYFGEGGPNQPHLAMSVTKSFVGVIAAEFVAQGKLDRAAPVTRYVPELAGTAYDGATVGDVMDMRIGVRYSELYSDPEAEVWDYSRAGGLVARGDRTDGPRNVVDFLLTLQQEGPHGGKFAYKTVNTEVLAWILRRVANRRLSDLVSEMIWAPLGMEEDAYFNLDETGAEVAGGGFNATARDMARFGEMIRLRGVYEGRRILSSAALDDIFAGGDQNAFEGSGYPFLPGWSYRNMWWITHDTHGSITARGVFGQCIYIDPVAEVVIARFASHPVASNAANEPITRPSFQAIAQALAAGSR